ncbi:uncharacterized protein LOC131146239 [Malania oleifera]|uniref:uncharacterized protein LOC131146239 n=1 Tax=Malania oleifera TaxID=397392 RepID=UPI0025AEC2FE|nr:uncharacterized protein LOC131146239 [Malania oleifera]
MVDDSIDIPAISEKNELEGVNERRNSSGKLSIQSDGVKVQSRYLRASAGSCHDFCKYGGRHAFEAKKKSSISKRITLQPGEGRDLTNAVTLMESIINLKPSDSQTKISDSPVFKREGSSSTKKLAVSLQQVASPGEDLVISTKCASTLKQKPVRTKPPFLSAVGRLGSKRNNGVDARKQRGASGKCEMEVFVASTVLLSLKASVRRAVNIKGRDIAECKNLERAFHLKNQNNVEKPELKKPSNEEAPEKTLYIIEPTAEKKTVQPTQNDVQNTRLPPSSEDKRLKCAQNGSNSAELPPSSDKKSLIHKDGIQMTCLSPSSSPSSENKSLGCTQTGTCAHQLSSSSILSLLPAMLPPESIHGEEKETFSKLVETEVEVQVTNPKVEKKSRLLKGGINDAEDKDCTPQKLGFKRGKVVYLQSRNNSPRRLRFRRGGVLGDNQKDKGDLQRRSIKIEDAGDFTATKAESEKVVLRHQDIQGKKDAQSLFNNVIEETANKLVVSKKSKVQALVGAFETVISLQDSKPMAAAPC